MQEDIKHIPMNHDLISHNFTDTINKDLIKRNIRLLLLIIILFSVFTLFNLAEYYSLVVYSPHPAKETRLAFYSFKIRPWIYFLSVIIGFIVWVNYIKGHRLILLSFENDHADLFNKGYEHINKAGIANIIGYAVLIISAGARYFLKYL